MGEKSCANHKPLSQQAAVASTSTTTLSLKHMEPNKEPDAVVACSSSSSSSAAAEAATAKPQAIANGDTVSPSKETTEVLKTAMQHLAAGKRNLLVRDPDAAVSSLALACELLGKHYGEMAKECGESYFFYGKALLELARMEAGVIDNVLDGDESEDNSTEEEDAGKDESAADNDEDEADDNGEEDDAAVEPSSTTEKVDATADIDSLPVCATEAATGQDGSLAREDAESIGSNEAGTSKAKDNCDKTAVDQEDLEDLSNLQLAWEMLELSRNIFQKHLDSLEGPSETRLELEAKLSEVYQLLGEVSIESECYHQAIEDLNICLQRRQKLLPEDSRCIAETHYQLGMALGFNVRFDEAVVSLNNAIGVLQCRINNLKTGTESPDPNSKNDAFYSREREIAEIEGLIPEIREKIADTKDMKEETIKKLGDRRMYEESKECLSSSSAPASTSQQPSTCKSSSAITIATSKTSAPTNSIAHLVKKRKQCDDEPTPSSTEAAPEAKKLHKEEGPSSTGSSCAATNGNHSTD